jgi:hypothetical protein
VQAKEAELRQERERVLALSSAEAELGGRLQGAEERARGLESRAQELEGRLEEQRGQCRELEGARAAGEERLAVTREELLRAREQGSGLVAVQGELAAAREALGTERSRCCELEAALAERASE